MTGLNAPQFPGQQVKGMSIDQIRTLVKKQNNVAIQGFQDITAFSFKVNNEIIIDSLDPNFISNFFTNDEYYYLPRPLSGTDQITITFTNPGATENTSLAIYYI